MMWIVFGATWAYVGYLAYGVSSFAPKSSRLSVSNGSMEDRIVGRNKRELVL
jgi:hypothetical protein